MSFVRLTLQAIGRTSHTGLQRVTCARSFSQSFVHCNEPSEKVEITDDDKPTEKFTTDKFEEKLKPSSDRSKPVSYQISIKYLESDAYNQTYGNDPVWKMYRRNFKGQFAPLKTRKTCVRNEAIATSNPCPICRDEYLVLDHRNVKLLNQFISPYNGEIINYRKTGLCQRQHQNLLIAIIRAKNFGTISFDVPFRYYNYSEWYNFPETDECNDKEQ